MKAALFCNVFFCGTAIFLINCGKQDKSGTPPSFKSKSSTTLLSSNLATSALSLAPRGLDFVDATEPAEAKCVEMTTCFTPTNITGKILAAGLGISAKGQLETYIFGGDKYSGLSPDAGSPLYDFDFKAPVVVDGTLICCNGSSSFESEGYFQTAKFLAAYVDVTIDFAAPNNTKLNGTHTYRFVIANYTSLGYKRGDILYKDPTDEIFKWASPDGTLSITRPESPATQDTAVVNWSNKAGQGNTEIPVLEAGFVGEEKVIVTRADLEKNNLKFSFDLNPKNSIVINKELSMLNMFNTQYDIMSNLIFRGLPYSKLALPGSAFISKLTFQKTTKTN